VSFPIQLSTKDNTLDILFIPNTQEMPKLFVCSERTRFDDQMTKNKSIRKFDSKPGNPGNLKNEN
jgi:hypothetical protein